MCINSARTQTMLNERQKPLCFLCRKIVTSSDRNTNLFASGIGNARKMRFRKVKEKQGKGRQF